MCRSQCHRRKRSGAAGAADGEVDGGGFELSDPEKPPLEHGFTATEGRSARVDWGAGHSLAAKPGKVSDRQTFRNEGKFGPHFKGQFWKRHLWVRILPPRAKSIVETALATATGFGARATALDEPRASRTQRPRRFAIANPGGGPRGAPAQPTGRKKVSSRKNVRGMVER